MNYFEWQVEQAPPWFNGTMGEGWWLFWGHLRDGWAEGAKQAVKARFPSTAAPDALQSQAGDRGTERYPAETESAFRVRLAETFDRYLALGTPEGLGAALAAVPGVVPRTPTLDDPVLVGYREAWQWDAGSPLWARFWVVLATGWGLPSTWGEAGAAWGEGAKKWGIDAPRESLDFLRRQVRRWKAAHAKCEAIIIEIDGATVWGRPDATWGEGKTWGAGKVVRLEA